MNIFLPTVVIAIVAGGAARLGLIDTMTALDVTMVVFALTLGGYLVTV